MSTSSETEHRGGAGQARLLQALTVRGFLSQEEADRFRKAHPHGGETAETLDLLVREGFLTPNQARRASQDLEAILQQPIPGYVLLEVIGQGSMGKVYKARQLSMDRLVAIKILKPRLATDPNYVERFMREAHLAAQLSSANIVQAIDVGAAGPIRYFVMEYVEGTTVKEVIESGVVYGEREALEIVLQVARALEHAHRKHLVHRDVKPANIILTRDGVAKLADLGLACRVDDPGGAEQERGATVGTPYYIAPELIGGRHEADIRSDIYSLGATLYHMVTGRPPFPGSRIRDVFEGHLHGELIPPDHINTSLTGGLGEVVEFMMARNREERYQTPAELILDLECLLAGEPPKLARQRSQYLTLEQLVRGETLGPAAQETVTDDAPLAEGRDPWLIGLSIALALSILLNLILLTLLVG